MSFIHEVAICNSWSEKCYPQWTTYAQFLPFTVWVHDWSQSSMQHERGCKYKRVPWRVIIPFLYTYSKCWGSFSIQWKFLLNFSCSATNISQFKSSTQIHSQASEFQIFLCCGLPWWSANISSHKSVFSQQQFLAGLVSSNPTISLAKHWLGMTLQSTEELTVSVSQPAINNTHGSMRNQNCTKMPLAFLQKSHAACLLYTLTWHWASNAQWQPAAFIEPSGASVSKSQRGRETERWRMGSPERQKDKSSGL